MKQEEVPSWSIAELAKLSRVSSRTLRHYHQLGLLAPAYTGHNGCRYYTRTELLRLQRILLLRELGLGLESIGEVLVAPYLLEGIKVYAASRLGPAAG